MTTIVHEIQRFAGRSLRNLRDQLHARDLAWETIPGSDLRIKGGNWIAAGSSHEEIEIALFKRALPLVDAVVDVGANSGVYSCLAAAAGKPTFAFEPLRDNLDTLYGNIAENGLADRIEVFPLAASDSVGIAKFFGRGQGASLVKGWAGQPEYDYEQVPTNTLDNLLADRLAGQSLAIKIDVEGAELAVLRGAERLLAGCRALLLEHSLTRNQPTGTNPDFLALFERLWAAGFTSSVADKAETPVDRAKVEGWLKAGNSGLATENFLFLRPAA